MNVKDEEKKGIFRLNNVSVSEAAVIQLRDLKQQEFIFSQLWMLEGQN